MYMETIRLRQRRGVLVGRPAIYKKCIHMYIYTDFYVQKQNKRKLEIFFYQYGYKGRII